jgi:hypothetical protein
MRETRGSACRRSSLASKLACAGTFAKIVRRCGSLALPSMTSRSSSLPLFPQTGLGYAPLKLSGVLANQEWQVFSGNQD